MFQLGRIRRYEVLEERFEVPADFDLKAFLANAHSVDSDCAELTRVRLRRLEQPRDPHQPIRPREGDVARDASGRRVPRARAERAPPPVDLPRKRSELSIHPRSGCGWRARCACAGDRRVAALARLERVGRGGRTRRERRRPRVGGSVGVGRGAARGDGVGRALALHSQSQPNGRSRGTPSVEVRRDFEPLLEHLVSVNPPELEHPHLLARVISNATRYQSPRLLRTWRGSTRRVLVVSVVAV